MPRLLLLLLILMANPVNASINKPLLSGHKITGEAFSLDGMQLQYRELHCISDNLTRHRVDYVDANGKLIAQKQLRYDSDVTTPDFTQLNLRNNEVIEVTLADDTVSMSYLSEDETDSKGVDIAVSQDTPLVIDAGFDAFVQLNWNRLQKGEAIDFQFPLASRSSLVDLRIQAQECPTNGDLQKCFRMDLSSWFFRMMVDPVELVYHADTRQLLRFRGLSNIEDKNGNGYIVDISYQYTESGIQTCGLQPMVKQEPLPATIGLRTDVQLKVTI